MNRPAANEADPAVLTVDEVAAALRVSSWSVYRRIEEGTLHAVRVGRHFRVPRAELERFLTAEVA